MILGAMWWAMAIERSRPLIIPMMRRNSAIDLMVVDRLDCSTILERSRISNVHEPKRQDVSSMVTRLLISFIGYCISFVSPYPYRISLISSLYFSATLNSISEASWSWFSMLWLYLVVLRSFWSRSIMDIFHSIAFRAVLASSASSIGSNSRITLAIFFFIMPLRCQGLITFY